MSRSTRLFQRTTSASSHESPFGLNDRAASAAAEVPTLAATPSKLTWRRVACTRVEFGGRIAPTRVVSALATATHSELSTKSIGCQKAIGPRTSYQV